MFFLDACCPLRKFNLQHPVCRHGYINGDVQSMANHGQSKTLRSVRLVQSIEKTASDDIAVFTVGKENRLRIDYKTSADPVNHRFAVPSPNRD